MISDEAVKAAARVMQARDVREVPVVIMCDASNPGMDGDVYHLPYTEAVEGHRHGYMTKHNGVEWTRNINHPPDLRCPECASYRGRV